MATDWIWRNLERTASISFSLLFGSLSAAFTVSIMLFSSRKIPLRFSLICSTCSTSDLTADPFPLPLPLLWAGSTGWNVVMGSGVVALAVLGMSVLSSFVAPSYSWGVVCSAGGVVAGAIY